MRTLLIFFSLFSILIFLVGCGSFNNQHEQTGSAVEDSIKTEAIYIGLIDSHSIEVIINQTPTAIQISEEQFKTLELLETNTPITITYYVQKSTSQNILEKIEITD